MTATVPSRPRLSVRALLGLDPDEHELVAVTSSASEETRPPPRASAGLIADDGEVVGVRDRSGLEAAGCDCSVVVRDEYDRLL